MQHSTQNACRNRLTVPAILLTATLLVVAFVYAVVTTPVTQHNPTVSQRPQTTMVTHRDAVKPSTVAKPQEPTNASLRNTPDTSGLNALLGPLSPAQQQWLSAHGYGTTDFETDLPWHEREQLHAEAISGDRQAIDHYAAVAALRGQPDATDWLQRSAVNGSTQALLRLASWYSRGDSAVNQKEAIAWLLVAQQRGDPFASQLLPTFTENATATDASALAATLYKQLETERYRQGLPAFENSGYPTE